MFKPILDAIKRHDTIIIHRHANPDGDCLGAQVGLFHIIRDNFPGKEVLMTGDGSKRYAFILDGCSLDVIPDEKFKDALSIILDTSSEELIYDSRYRIAHESARIDHHIFLGKIADFEAVDTSYESCCGLVTQFAMNCSLKVSQKAAQALFTGTVTDSGRFRYDCTTSGTLRRSAFLLDCGVDYSAIYKKLYVSEFETLRLRAYFIRKIQFTNHNVAYYYTDKAELEEQNISPFNASRGFVNTMSEIEGVDIWAAFAECESGIMCEIRSSEYNINPIAVKYGGGGHAKASGATVPDREAAMAMLADLDEMAANGSLLP